jgi:hypothetical protein
VTVLTVAAGARVVDGERAPVRRGRRSLTTIGNPVFLARER